jgi:hypothetical protein
MYDLSVEPGIGVPEYVSGDDFVSRCCIWNGKCVS